MASRPVSWVNTAYPFAVGYIVMGGGAGLRLLIGTLFFLIPYNLLMYGINDVFDYESDIRNPRKGGIEGGITPKKHHSLIIWSSIMLALPFVIYLLAVGTVNSALVLFSVLFFVVAYSVKGLRFKEKPFLDSVTSSIHFVGPLLFAYSLVGTTNEGLIAAVAFFLWGVASQAFGAVQDVLPDREAGMHSVATVLGARATVRFSLVLYVVSSVLVGLLGGVAYVVAIISLVYAINLWPYVNISDTTSSRARKGWRRFIWLNYIVGAVITMCLVAAYTVYG